MTILDNKWIKFVKDTITNIFTKTTTIDGKVDIVTTDIAAARTSIEGKVDNVDSDLAAARTSIESMVQGLQNNVSLKTRIPSVIERNELSDKVVELMVYNQNSAGGMDDFDSAPTVTIKDQTGSYAKEADNTTDINVLPMVKEIIPRTGVYKYSLTIHNDMPLGTYSIEIAGVEGGTTKYFGASTMITDIEKREVRAVDSPVMGNLLTDGTLQSVITKDGATNGKEFLDGNLVIDCSAMAAGDTLYYEIKGKINGIVRTLYSNTISDAQTEPIIIEGIGGQYFQINIQQTAGVYRNFGYEFTYKEAA